MQRSIKIASRLTYGAMLTILLLMVALTVIPSGCGLGLFGVVSGSMEPAIASGSLVVVDKNVTGDEVSAGDVIAFDIGDPGHTICTHRVVDNDLASGSLSTKGDANEAADLARVPYERMVGRAIIALPGLGGALLAATQNRGVLIVASMALMGIAILLSSLARSGKEKPSTTEKELIDD